MIVQAIQVIKVRWRTLTVWFFLTTLLGVGWLEDNAFDRASIPGLSAGAGTGALLVFAGMTLCSPLISVVFAAWGAASANDEIRHGMDKEMKVRQIPVSTLVIPQLLIVMISGGVLVALLSGAALFASSLTVSWTWTGPSFAWLGYWLALVCWVAFLWLTGYYLTMITRSSVGGIAATASWMWFGAMGPARNLPLFPGTAFYLWSTTFPFSKSADLRMLRELVTWQTIRHGYLSWAGLVVSAIFLLVIHRLSEDRTFGSRMKS